MEDKLSKIRLAGFAFVTPEERDAIISSSPELLSAPCAGMPGTPVVVYRLSALHLVITFVFSKLGELDLERRRLMQSLEHLETLWDYRQPNE